MFSTYAKAADLYQYWFNLELVQVLLCNSAADVTLPLNLIRIVTKLSITVGIAVVHDGDSFIGNDWLLCAR